MKPTLTVARLGAIGLLFFACGTEQNVVTEDEAGVGGGFASGGSSGSDGGDASDSEASLDSPLDVANAPDGGGCAGLDEATCAATAHCAPIYGRDLAKDLTGYAGCFSNETLEGDAYAAAACPSSESCGVDPDGRCWFFTASACVPDGWSSDLECTAPECAGAKDAG